MDRLAAADQAAISLLGRTFRAPGGTVLMFEHEPAERVVILNEGHVRVTRSSAGGRETLLAIRGPGELLGAVALAGIDVHGETATTMEPVEGLILSRAAVKARADRSPALVHALLSVLAEQYIELSGRQARHCGLDTLGRTAAVLVELADRHGARRGDDAVVINIPIRQDELTAWTGASRAGLTKALQTLRELGWIETQRKRIVVTNVWALRDRAAQ